MSFILIINIVSYNVPNVKYKLSIQMIKVAIGKLLIQFISECRRKAAWYVFWKETQK